MKKREIILPNQKYNFLTIISFSYSDSRGRKWYNTKCDCGNEKIIMGSAMVSGNTKSCGCYSSKFQKERNLLPDNLGVKRHIIAQYKRHAKRRNLIFNISENDFINLISKNCFYCGLPPSNLKKTKNYKQGLLYSGIDRVVSSNGYNKENCVPCCEQCNKSKMAQSEESFLSWIKRVYEFNHKQAMATQWSEYVIKQKTT